MMPFPVAAVPPSFTRPRRLHPLVTAVLVLVLLCGGAMAALYFWLGLNRTNQLARIVPADTVALVSVSPSLWQLPQLRNAENLQGGLVAFAPLVALPGVIQLVNRVDLYLPLDLEIEPATDILPWIGREVSVAILPEDSGLSDGRFDCAQCGRLHQARLSSVYNGPPIVLAAATRNQAASDAFINKVRAQWEREGVQFADSLYQGIPVMVIVEPRDMSLAMATFNDLVVIATDLTSLQETIDRAQGQGGQVLSESFVFQEMLDNLKGNRLAYLYLDVPQLITAIPAQERPWQLQALQNAGVAASLTSQGVRLDYALYYDENHLSPLQTAWLAHSASPNRLVERTPHDTWLYLSGQNLAMLWQTFETPEMRETLRELEVEVGLKQLGIDSTTDIVSQLSGEFALAVTSAAMGFNNDEVRPPELLAMVHVADERAMADTLDSLQAANTYFVQDEIDNVPVRLAGERDEQSMGYGFIENLLLIGSSWNVLAQAIRADGDSLADNELFQRAIGPLPDKNHGYFYLDIAASYDLLEEILTEDIVGGEVRLFLEDIQAISLAVAPMDDKYVQHGTFYVVTNKD
jgi:hypothetical protein